MKQLVTLLLLFSALSLHAGGNLFLRRNLSPSDKAEALCRKGIEKYDELLVQQEEISRLAEVRKYFEKAAAFDEANVTARLYLSRVDRFPAERAGRYMDAYERESRRSDRDEMTMLLNISGALRIDPAHPEALAAFESTRKVRQDRIAAMMKKAAAAERRFDEFTTAERKDPLAIEAWKEYSSVSRLDAGNRDAQKGALKFSDYLTGRFSQSEAEIMSSIRIPALAMAQKGFETLEVLAVSHELKVRYTELDHELSLAQADEAYKKKEYKKAAGFIARAASIRKDKRTLALKAGIEAGLRKVKMNDAFEDMMTDVDKLVEQGDLSAARDRLDSLQSQATDTKKKAGIQTKLRQVERDMGGSVDKLYQQAVDSYNEERYDEAIKRFKQVQQVAPGYRDTQRYLSKAREKKELVETF